MTTTVNLFFESSHALTDSDLAISIDNSSVTYTVENSKIIIETDITFGFHILSVNLTNSTNEIRFNNIQVNGSSLRHTLYLSYTLVDSTPVNNTVLSMHRQNWHLPFGNPVSWWLAECSRNIRTRMYGKNLVDYYGIYYPESVIVDSYFPQTVKDFFKYNFGFHAYEKEGNENPFHNMQVPYIPLKNLHYNEEKMLQEFMGNLDAFTDSKYIPEQNNYLLDELDQGQEQSKSVPWQILRLSLGPEKHDMSNIFPEFSKLTEQLENDGVIIGMTFLAALYPNSFVSPHLDDYHRQADFLANQKGCCKIWIPIGWKPGNYFKLDRVGLIPIDQGAQLINPNCFTHASVNQSDTVRFTVAFNCYFPDGVGQKYL